MSYDVDEGRTEPVVETGENLRLWGCKGSRNGEVANMPFVVAFAAPKMLALLRQCLEHDHGDHRPTCDPYGYRECFHGEIKALIDEIDGVDGDDGD